MRAERVALGVFAAELVSAVGSAAAPPREESFAPAASSPSTFNEATAHSTATA